MHYTYATGRVIHTTDEFAAQWNDVDNSPANTHRKQELCNTILAEFQLLLARHGASIEANSDGNSDSNSTSSISPSEALVAPMHVDTQRWGAAFVGWDSVDVAGAFGQDEVGRPQ